MKRDQRLMTIGFCAVFLGTGIIFSAHADDARKIEKPVPVIVPQNYNNRERTNWNDEYYKRRDDVYVEETATRTVVRRSPAVHKDQTQITTPTPQMRLNR